MYNWLPALHVQNVSVIPGVHWHLIVAIGHFEGFQPVVIVTIDVLGDAIGADAPGLVVRVHPELDSPTRLPQRQDLSLEGSPQAPSAVVNIVRLAAHVISAAWASQAASNEVRHLVEGRRPLDRVTESGEQQ